MNSKNTIPLNDLTKQHEPLRGELDSAIAKLIATNSFIGGAPVRQFAEAFADFCGVGHAIPCANGTEALRIAILAVLGPGNGTCEIITASHTFAATAEAICHAGYRPVFVDVEPTTYLMDLDEVEAACTDSTIAIVPVHLYGQMVDMNLLSAIAGRRGLAIIEDAAQAHGANFNEIGPGQLSNAASFSFFPGKNLGAWGDAGAIVTKDDDVARCAAQLIDHGRSDKFTHTRMGCNARMDAIQAAVLNIKLAHLDDWNKARREAAGWYDSLLANDQDCVAPTVAECARHVFHQYVVQVPQRDAVRSIMQETGIATGVHYPIPLHEQPAFGDLGLMPDSLPVTHGLCQRILSLPMFPGITRQQVERVAQTLMQAVSATSSVTV